MTQYGLVIVVVLLLLHLAIARPIRHPTRPQAILVGSLVACTLPAHVLIFVLGVVGVTLVAVALLVVTRIRAGTTPSLTDASRAYVSAAVGMVVVTAAWGLLTGHGLPSGGASAGVEPFNATWLASIVLVLVGAGVFLCIPLMVLISKDRTGPMPAVGLAAIAILGVGAAAWGLRVADFNSFHLFFGALAVIVVPVAIVAFAVAWRHAGRRARLVLLALAVAQLQVGAVSTLFRLERFGALAEDPLPGSIVEAISQLPADAKLAYQCEPLEEIAIWDPHFGSIDAHTGRRVISMCFQADAFGVLIGGQLDPTAINPAFQVAPQRALFPDAAATPSESDVVSFLRANGVAYLFVDSAHPNTLVPNAEPVAVSGATMVLSVP